MNTMTIQALGGLEVSSEEGDSSQPEERDDSQLEEGTGSQPKTKDLCVCMVLSSLELRGAAETPAMYGTCYAKDITGFGRGPIAVVKT